SSADGSGTIASSGPARGTSGSRAWSRSRRCRLRSSRSRRPRPRSTPRPSSPPRSCSSCRPARSPPRSPTSSRHSRAPPPWRPALDSGEGAAGAHVIHELWMRGEFADRIETALAALWKQAAPSIPEWLPMRYVDWLPLAYEVALGFRAAARGRYNVYLVLLDYEDRTRGPYGVYVGMSHLPPAQRFDRHK